jgi:nucleotide-binding universal stress UspA family protein
MSFKTILSIVGVDHSGADLVAAAELCDRTGAHLNAVVVSCVPPPPVGDLIGQSYSTWSFAWQEENKRVQDRAAELGQRLSDKGLQGDVQPLYCVQGDVDDEIAERARYADVSLIGPDLLKDESLLHRVIDGALFGSSAPVILFGRNKPVDLAPATVLVGWNSRIEASAAVRQALGLLTGAQDVHVALVDPEATSYAMGQEPGADVATYLSRHGIRTTVDVLSSGGREVGEVLRQHAADIDAKLIVMGGYGHSRMRERIFGGATKSMLENVDTPVLLGR